MFHSFKAHDRFVVAVACLFLACKVEEEPRRIKNVILAYFDVRGLLRDAKTIKDEVGYFYLKMFIF
jgi:hypothetical protein